MYLILIDAQSTLFVAVHKHTFSFV
jgi:hypothetical protein